MSDTMMIEVPTTERMLACCAGIAGDGHEPQSTKPSTVAAEYLGTDTPSLANIAEKLTPLRFNINTPPPDTTSVFKTSTGATIATRGNISALTAQAKAGKSAFIAAMIAAGITPKPDDCDLLGVRAVNLEGLPVLLLDTEHSPHHHHSFCDRILRRAMLTESEQLHAYRLAGLSVADLTAALEHLLNERKWLAVILDGTGDFVADVNDPKECNRFIARLHGLAIQHVTHILNVLHLNPGSEFKSRGHLGSQLERKAETNLRIEKVHEISVVFADKNRGAAIPKNNGPRFAWSTDKQMHVSIASRLQTQTDAKLEDSRMKVAEGFRLAGNSALHYSELIAAIRQVPGSTSESTAERHFRLAKQAGHISQNLLKQWHITP